MRARLWRIAPCTGLLYGNVRTEQLGVRPLVSGVLSTKVRSEFFDMAHTGIFDFPASDLLDRALRHAGFGGNGGPVALGLFQLVQNVFVNGFHNTRC